MSNAAKYTERGFIEARFEKVGYKHRESVLVTVCDTGVGIEPEKQTSLFKIYDAESIAALRSAHGRTKMAGIGLTVSNKICHFMGSELTVQSDQGRGSTF